MRHLNLSIMVDRELILFKWLMVCIPPVTVAVGHSLPTHTGDSPAGTLLVTLLVTSLALVLAYLFSETMFKTLRKLQAEALARDRDILTMNAAMRERERLSRELHDGVAQLVAHLLVRLDTVKDLVEAGRPRDAAAKLERLHGVANELYEDVGESITETRANVTERGLIRTLQDYVDRFEARHQIPVHLRADDAADRLPPLAAFQIFRLVQEGLTNVRKHAGAREATVTLTADGPNRLRVVVADDGRGFAPGSQRSDKVQPLGLTSMRERVETLGGTFDVQRHPVSGTHVVATIPVPPTTTENRHATVAPSSG